jgi:outer membrane lipoprotein SlyB
MGEMSWLILVRHRTCRLLSFVWLTPLLAACAGTVPAPAPQAGAPTGQLRLGTVISVRPAAFDGNDAAVQRILGTLNVPVPPEQNAVELVIRRQDNSVVSVVQPAGPGQPAFVSGERVMIVEAAKTVVQPQ